MDYSVVVESLRSKLLFVQKIARNTALAFLLISLVIPVSFQIVSTQAHDADSINSNIKVKVEKVKKDKTVEIKEVTLEELQADSELNSFGKFNHTEQIKQTNLNLTPNIIRQIEAQKGVVYENETAVVNPVVLANLGYNPEQIQAVQNMVNFYNFQSTKQLKVSIDELTLSKNRPNLLTIQAQAACTPKAETKFEWWGFRSVLDGCAVNEAKWNYSQFAAIIGLWSLTPCTWICAVLAAYQGGIVGALEYQNNRCNGQGAILTIVHPGLWSVEPIC
jgi:hypothetical protein